VGSWKRGKGKNASQSKELRDGRSRRRRREGSGRNRCKERYWMDHEGFYLLVVPGHSTKIQRGLTVYRC